MITSPNIPLNKKQFQYCSWQFTNTDKQNEPFIRTRHRNIKPNNISKFKVNTPHLIDAMTAYLFLLKYPTIMIQKLNTIDKSVAKTKLYSISNKEILGPQTVFTQNI